ncbi:MAG: hypothetical protein IJS82_02985 [Paludibacteraceae bacterium]|nr:hypothetical protein [Paludibacteraceae bacterium]
MKKSLSIVVWVVVWMTLPIGAQSYYQADQPSSQGMPAVEFQSTSTLSASGSPLSSTPALNADGTVSSPTASYTPAAQPTGPRKISPTTPEGDPTPVGDALWPLMLMALAYGGVVALRRRKALKDEI